MLIVCPACATSYNLTPESLGPAGRKVRCARCGELWHEQAPREARLLAAAGALSPEPEPAPAPEPEPPGGIEAENVTLYADDIPLPPETEEWTSEPDDGLQPDTEAPEAEAPEAEVPEAEASEAEVPETEAPETDLPEEAEAPPIVPVDLDQGRAFPITDEPAGHALDAAALADIESLAARPRRRQAKRAGLRWPLSRLHSVIIALALLDFMLVGLRSDMVRFFPQTASFYGLIGLPVNLRGLAFDDIVTAREQHEGVPVLLVEGNIVNVARKSVEVPRLRFAVRNPAGNEIYSWTMVPSRTVLPAGEAVAFRSRLASPPPEGRDVLVRFFTRRDVIAGIR